MSDHSSNGNGLTFIPGHDKGEYKLMFYTAIANQCWSARSHAPLLSGNSNEALSASKRSIHDYTRNTNFESIVKIYDSPGKVKTSPKCKLSLSNRLDNAAEHATSRSSLSSIPSIEWDGRCKSDYALRTKSLPRNMGGLKKLYRTRSHSGFINSFIKDPQPLHYHLPRCQSCGTVSIHSLKDDVDTFKNNIPTSLYLSMDNIYQKCIEETEKVKVKETMLPVFKVPKVPEFVESQEFNEDNYLGELNSFSSNNQTVIEKVDVTVTKVDDRDEKDDESSATYRAEYAVIENDENDNTLETTEGEYHSFTDEFEEAYESPVKDLVEKDIRDYSVPIDFYCEDYNQKNDSPKKSPFKCREATLNVLEPILEESKSSYGDDSGNLSNEKRDSDVQSIAEKNDDVFEPTVDAVQSNVDCKEVNVQINSEKQAEESSNIMEQLNENTVSEINMHERNNESSETASMEETKVDNETCEIENISEERPDVILAVYDTTQKVELFENEPKHDDNKDERKSSIDYSVTSTVHGSFNSTVEFEKYEAITDLLANLLNKIDYEGIGKDFLHLSYKKHNTINLFEDKCIAVQTDTMCNINKDETKIDTESTTEGDDVLEKVDVHFSITKLIQEFEEQAVGLNETVLTEISDNDINEPFKVAESLLYYIFDRVFIVDNDKNKKRTNKRVVTVVDAEDIMYTAVTLWPEIDENENFQINFNFEPENNFEVQLNDLEVVNNDFVEQYNLDVEHNDIDEEQKAFIAEHEKNCGTAQQNIYANVGHKLDEAIAYNPCELAEYIEPNFDEIDYHITNFNKEHQNNYNLYESIDGIDCVKQDHEKCEASSNTNIAVDKEITYNFHETYFKHVKYEVETKMELNELDLYKDDHPEMENITESELNLALNNSTDANEYQHNSEYNNDDYSATDDEECQELSQTSVEIAEDIILKLFNHDLNTDEAIGDEIVVIENDSMNTAFVHDEFHSHASSPRNHSEVFEVCDESPIRKPSTSFADQDLSILYDKDDTILGSPFVKQKTVISMSQTQNAGGMKYWLSFDEKMTDNNISYSRRSFKNTDDIIPSFYGFNFGDEQVDNNNFNRKQSVLINKIDETHNSEENKQGIADNVTSPSSSYFYDTCESTLLDDSLQKTYFDNSHNFDSPQKKLLYEVQRRKDRLYTTWPPYEDTLFYRIISQFRMSESFDSSELDRARIDAF